MVICRAGGVIRRYANGTITVNLAKLSAVERYGKTIYFYPQGTDTWVKSIKWNEEKHAIAEMKTINGIMDRYFNSSFGHQK